MVVDFTGQTLWLHYRRAVVFFQSTVKRKSRFVTIGKAQSVFRNQAGSDGEKLDLFEKRALVLQSEEQQKNKRELRGIHFYLFIVK